MRIVRATAEDRLGSGSHPNPHRRDSTGGRQRRGEMSHPVMHFELIGKDAIALQKFYAGVFGWKLSPPMAEFGNYSLVDN